MRLPMVLVSSVIRSKHKGESHGGVYLVDLESGRFEQVVDWDTVDIDWAGRGEDRGLRGIAFHRGEVWIAASDEIFVFDRAFRIVRSFRNPFLRHCHEMCIAGGRLYLTSTGFDSVLVFDLDSGRFVWGYTMRDPSVAPAPPATLVAESGPFDPAGAAGPAPGDTVHINNVHVEAGTLFVAALRLPTLFTLSAHGLDRYASVPVGTHNARPLAWHGTQGVLANCTHDDVIRLMDRDGAVLREYPVPAYPEAELLHANLPRDHARQAFGRGLCVIADGLFCAGSSPSTVSVYDLGSERPEPLRRINLTMDVRNAVHGLAVWPYA